MFLTIPFFRPLISNCCSSENSMLHPCPVAPKMSKRLTAVMASSPLVTVIVVVVAVDTASCCPIALLCPPPPPSHCVVHLPSTPSSSSSFSSSQAALWKVTYQPTHHFFCYSCVGHIIYHKKPQRPNFPLWKKIVIVSMVSTDYSEKIVISFTSGPHMRWLQFGTT